MPTATATLRASLEKHNNTFESLLRLIPAQYYIVNEETEEQVSSSLKTHPRIPSKSVFQAASKYQKHSKKQKAPKQAIKEASKKAKREKVRRSFHFFILKLTTPKIYPTARPSERQINY